MSNVMISIADQFSRFPAGRYPGDGPYNGQRFRDDVLLPAVENAVHSGTRVTVLLDGVIGYSSSFLEEVFGGLVRSGRLPFESIKRALEIRAEDDAYLPAKLDAESYLEEEARRRR